MKVETLFDQGDKVIIDGDKSIVATVTATCIRGKNTTHEVSYFHNGTKTDMWIEDWRLDKWAE